MRSEWRGFAPHPFIFKCFSARFGNEPGFFDGRGGTKNAEKYLPYCVKPRRRNGFVVGDGALDVPRGKTDGDARSSAMNIPIRGYRNHGSAAAHSRSDGEIFGDARSSAMNIFNMFI